MSFYKVPKYHSEYTKGKVWCEKRISPMLDIRHNRTLVIYISGDKEKNGQVKGINPVIGILGITNMPINHKDNAYAP